MTTTDLQTIRSDALRGRPTLLAGRVGRFGSRSLAQDAPPVCLFERAMALSLLILAAPILAVLALAVLLVDGRPAFYRGQRLGLRKSLFTMYKIRTLRREASRRTATRLLSARDGLEIPGGRFLRESRLDELPQLWNVVRGEMRFVGPRPERPQVYRFQCRDIPGYDRRFDVRPGMIGPSQLFTPHSTPKRVRAWLDNTWSRKRQPARALAGLALYTLIAVGTKVIGRAGRFVIDDLWRCKLLKRYRPRRRLNRVRFRTALARITSTAGRVPETLARLVDMNEEALCVRCAPGLEEGMTARARLEIELPGRNGRRRVRGADCEVIVVQKRDDALVLEYSPRSRRSDYVLHQYFLGESLAAPPSRSTAGLSARA